MITYTPGGGLGNRLFMYIFARLLAEKNGLELGTSWEQANQKGFGAVHQEENYKLPITFTPPTPGQRIDGEAVVLDERKFRDLSTDTELPPQHYHLQGYWQTAEWYLPHRKKILSWVKEKIPDKKLMFKNKMVMHVRLGDYKWCGPRGQVLDPQYYFDCIDRSGNKVEDICVLTDHPEDEYFHILRSRGVSVGKGKESNDFWMMMLYDTIVCGNSSFSWWAAFLSNASKIYIPGCWMRDLHNTVRLTNIQNGIIMPATFQDYDYHGQPPV